MFCTSFQKKNLSNQMIYKCYLFVCTISINLFVYCKYGYLICTRNVELLLYAITLCKSARDTRVYKKASRYFPETIILGCQLKNCFELFAVQPCDKACDMPNGFAKRPCRLGFTYSASIPIIPIYVKSKRCIHSYHSSLCNI